MNLSNIISKLMLFFKKYGISLAVIVLVISSAIRVLSAEPEINNEPVLPAISTLEVDSLIATDRIVATGTVESQDQVTIMSEVSAPVAAVFAQPGESVAAGTPLVQFESADFEAQLAQAAAGIQAAQAQISLQTAPPRDSSLAQAEAAVEQARAGLISATTNRDQTLVANRNLLTDTENGIEQLYRSAYFASLSGESSLRDSLTFISEYQENFLNCFNRQECLVLASEKSSLLLSAYDIRNAGRISPRAIQDLDEGIAARVNALSLDNLDRAALRAVINDLREYLLRSRELITIIESGVYSATVTISQPELSAIDQQRGAIDGAISSLDGILESFNTVERGVRGNGEPIALYEVRNTITRNERAADASVESAELALQSAQLALDNLIEGPREIDLAPLYAQLAQAQASFDAASASQRRYFINAPFGGEVISVNAQEGQLYSPGQSIITLANPNALEITVFISPDDRRTISRHAEVRVNDSVSGVITSIASGIDPATGKVEVRIALLDNADALLVGEVVTVVFEKEATENNRVQVPLSAVKTTPEGSYVFDVSDNNILIPHLVKTGSIEGNRIWITFDGSRPATIVENVRGLRAGDEVTR